MQNIAFTSDNINVTMKNLGAAMNELNKLLKPDGLLFLGIPVAAIAYINDNYADGELFFPNLDIQLKPKPGTMLFFPGNEEYEHGVKPVGEGSIRYVLVGFIKEKDHYQNNKY
jgi:hypothetical protein